ncbi:MAG: hypothetical protein J7K00_00385 [Candidatus Diapherotrites archaeon]|nr:hypothetical protein [Candidatus Diapherotrites archaeon]
MGIRSSVEAQQVLDMIEDPGKYFYTESDGVVIRNLNELPGALQRTKKDVFGMHVNEEKNDYSCWVRDVVGDTVLATRLLGTMDKSRTVQFVKERIFYLKKKAGLSISQKIKKPKKMALVPAGSAKSRVKTSSAKKATVKKAAVKKSVARSVKKTAKRVVKKVAVKKAVAKKVAVKKSVKKPAAKRSAVKKATAIARKAKARKTVKSKSRK